MVEVGGKEAGGGWETQRDQRATMCEMKQLRLEQKQGRWEESGEFWIFMEVEALHFWMDWMWDVREREDLKTIPKFLA